MNRLALNARRLVKLVHTGYFHTAERVCPEYPDASFKNHLKVYEFVTQFVRDKVILEIGCGTGYGTNFLADCAERIIAIDYSRQAIAYARRFYGHRKITYRLMNAERLDFPAAQFDFAFSSEVFEHLHNFEAHLEQVAAILKPGGLSFIATPNPEVTEQMSRFHVKEFRFEELRDLLRGHFSQVAIVDTLLSPPSARGIDPRAEFSIFGTPVDRSHLSNTHSFFAFAQK
jgi:2-polyprenyl-3-methyl-5-hydroxy-6-metoxy-1,4-benzoquinol methylase